ncbi:MAG TPA: PAS domain S-box protein, partial [Cyclobacteriaceae bacterium]
ISVIESAGLGTFDFDQAHRTFRASQRFAEIFGFDHPVPFESYMTRVHPEDYFVRESARQDVLEGRKLSYELRLLMPDKSIRWIRATAKVFFDERKKQRRWIGSVQDITSEKRSFQNLQESEARFRTLITETPEIGTAVYTGPEIRIQFVNTVMIKFWGKGDSVIGKTFIEALPETVDQPFYEQLRKVYTTGVTLFAKEKRALLEVNGVLTSRYYNYTYKALRNPNGEIYAVHHMAIDVTDQVSAKQQLIQSEASVRQLFMQTPVGIGVLKGRSLIIDLVNDAMLAYWKRTRGDVIGKPLWEVFPELASQGLAAVTAKIFETGESYFSPETPVEMMRNGKMEPLYVSFAFEPIRDNDGNITGMLSIGNDVTDLVVARKKSESNEARLQSLADSMPQLVWIADENGKVTYYNKQITNYDGVIKTADGVFEWIGMIHPDDCPKTGEVWTASIRDKTKYEVEHRTKMNDGTYRWHLTRGFPQNDDGGRTRWYGTSTDIQALKDAEMAVRESEERFRIISDATPSIIWALTPEGMHRYLNKFAVDYLGVPPGSVTQMNWDASLHPDDIEVVQAVLGNAIRNRISYKMEHRLRRHDGEYRWFLSQGGPSYYSDGTMYGFVGSGNDIHESKLSEEKLKKNEEMLENLVNERTLELQRSNDDLQQFAHVASHDLKEPIRKIKTFSYKLQDEYSKVLNERGNNLLDKIISSSDRMFAMINGVLNYSVVSAVKNNVEHVDLNNIVEDVKNDLELLISEKSATFHYKDLPTVYASADLIHQLFYNLINNSLKFSQLHKPSEISITSKPRTIGKVPYVEITIQDNGIGFDNEYAEQIFGTFVRLHSKDQFEGSGLGLALCKRIVERYGGSITAQGSKAGGSIFKFMLPT